LKYLYFIVLILSICFMYFCAYSMEHRWNNDKQNMLYRLMILFSCIVAFVSAMLLLFSVVP